VISNPVLFYCRRAQREFAAFDSSGVSIPIDMSLIREQKEWSERDFQPYGVATDEANGSLWYANKYDDTLWNVRVEYGDSLQLVPERILRFPREFCQPCGMDISDAGLLVACFGFQSIAASIFLISKSGEPHKIGTDSSKENTFSHCIFLPDGNIAYVARLDMSLWTNDLDGRNPRRVSAVRNGNTPANEGKLSDLAFQYVQGLYWSSSRQSLLISDASLGCIFEAFPNSNSYRVIAGVPAITDSTWLARLKPGTAERWLGPIRGLTENDKGEIVFLDGETGYPWILRADRTISPISKTIAPDAMGILGTGITFLNPTKG